nr:hypothetical protein NCPCFENI_00295 [Cupriavidus sp.]
MGISSATIGQMLDEVNPFTVLAKVMNFLPGWRGVVGSQRVST